jgi:hypothetical protein
MNNWKQVLTLQAPDYESRDSSRIRSVVLLAVKSFVDAAAYTILVCPEVYAATFGENSAISVSRITLKLVLKLLFPLGVCIFS